MKQQDVAELLTCMPNEFCSQSPSVTNAIVCNTRNEVICNVCFQNNLTEESSPILQLPVKKSIQSSPNTSLLTEDLLVKTAIIAIFVQKIPLPLSHIFFQKWADI